MKVIYTSLRQTPEMIVDAILRENVRMIGLSIFPGAHEAFGPRVKELLRAKEMNASVVVAMAEVFQPSASLKKIVHFICNSVKQAAWA